MSKQYKLSYSGFRYSLAMLTNPEGTLGPLRGHNLEVTYNFYFDSCIEMEDIYNWLDSLTKDLDHKTIISENQKGVEVHKIKDYYSVKWLNYRIELPCNEVYVIKGNNSHIITILENLLLIVKQNWKKFPNYTKIEVIGSDLPYRSHCVSELVR